MRAVSDSMLVLEENWLKGWPISLPYERIGKFILDKQLQDLVEARASEVKRPWWGKLAYAGFKLPSSEEPGALRGRSTSYLPCTLAWKYLDQSLVPAGPTLRRSHWLRDIRTRFAESRLPHFLCVQVILVTKDDQILMARRSGDVHFEANAWSASIEEQVSDGEGDALEEEVSAHKREWGPKPTDSDVADTMRRGLKEELGIVLSQSAIDNARCYALATDWRYSDVALICVVQSELCAAELADLEGKDLVEFTREASGIQSSFIPLSAEAIISKFFEKTYVPSNRPDWEGVWHSSAKLRLFAALAWMVQQSKTSWEQIARLIDDRTQPAS